MNECYVYMIRCGDGKKPKVKIGVSKNPDTRIKTLQTGNHEKLAIVMTIKCNSRKHAFLVEKTIHNSLSNQNVMGEWFSVNRSKFMKCMNDICNGKVDERIEKREELFASRATKDDGKCRSFLLQKIINLSDACRDQELAIKKYKIKVQKLREELKNKGLSDSEISKIIQ